MKDQLEMNGYAPDEITDDRLYEEMLDTMLPTLMMSE